MGLITDLSQGIPFFCAFFCDIFAAVMVPMVSRVRILDSIGPNLGVIWSRKAPIGPDFTIPVPETSKILSFLAMK